MSLLEKATLITTPTAHSDGTLHSIKGGAVADFDVVRGSAATRVNAEGLIEDIRIISGELITNGGFSNGGTDWTLDTGWSISEGKAVAVSGTASKLRQTNTLNGKSAKVTFTVSDYSSGLILVDFGSTSSPTINANGDYVFYGTYDQNNFEIYKSSNFIGSIDNISVVEVIDATNIPRIDYTTGEGVVLLEPQSTNLIPYSEEITQFNQNNVTTLNNQTISADGTQNASKVTKLGVSANDRLKEDISISSATSYNVSVFLKNDTIGGTTSLGVRISGGTLFRLGFDWSGSIPSISAAHSSGAKTNEIIENYGNGWYRVGFSFLSDGTDADLELDLDRGNSGDTTSLFVWGAQLEALSYATSYIPTSGAVATRLADSVSGAGDATTFNSTEGVLYAEATVEDTGTFKTMIRLTKTDTSTSDGLWIYAKSNNQLQGVLRVGSVDQVALTSPLTYSGFVKIAFKYKENDFALWINGVEVISDASGAVFSDNTLSKVGLKLGVSINPFYGKVKALAVFNEALTDVELECLTKI